MCCYLLGFIEGVLMTFKYRELFATILTATAAVFCSAAHAENGYMDIGIGAKSKGMGGVGVALPQDSLCAALNPAGMAMVGDRVDLGLNWLRQKGEAKFDSNGIAGTNRHFHSERPMLTPELGVNWMFEPDMSFGLSIYKFGTMNAKYNHTIPAFGSSTTRFEYSQMMASPSWSWLINDDHSIGIALNVALGRVKAKGVQNIEAFSAHPGHVSNRGYDYRWGVGARIGWIGHFGEYVSIGLTYQTTTWMSRFHDYKGLLAHRAEMNLPANAGAGIAICPVSELVLSADVLYVFWDDSDAMSNGGHRSSPFGRRNGSGFGWDNSWVVKFGMAYDVNEHLTLRVGYNHGECPIESEQAFLNALTLATIEDHITAGATVCWEENEITFFYTHGFEKEIHGHGSVPTKFGAGNANIEAHSDSVGLSYGYQY